MAEVRASAPGKVNLVLHCGAPQGGFHPLVTVFEAVSLREVVTVRTSRQRGIRVHTEAFNADGLPDPRITGIINELDPAMHLAVRAAKALQPLAALGPWADDAASLDIFVQKHVPVAGGMAGGSADAAATLVACNELWELGLSGTQLEQIGRTLGADVPACLMGGVCLGTGRGDHMRLVASGMNGKALSCESTDNQRTQHQQARSSSDATAKCFNADQSQALPASSRDVLGQEIGQTSSNALNNVVHVQKAHWWVLGLAYEGLSTPAVFAQIDRRSDPWPGLPQPAVVVDQLLPALQAGGAKLGAALLNDLEAPALRLRPELAQSMKAAWQAGAQGVTLSGSGPTIAALAANRQEAERIAHLWRQSPRVKEVLIACGPVPGARIEEVKR